MMQVALITISILLRTLKSNSFIYNEFPIIVPNPKIISITVMLIKANFNEKNRQHTPLARGNIKQNLGSFNSLNC